MEHLRPLDAAFLVAEDSDPHVSMAIGSVLIMAGPAPSTRDLIDALRPRLAAFPRFRQRIRSDPLGLATPSWVDVPDFDPEYHVRRTALPTPGEDDALCRLVGRVMSHRLDRDRPLWEFWIIEGLAGGRWAVLMKIHHCMADGMSGSRLFDALCDSRSARPTAERSTEPAGENHTLLGTLLALPLLPLRMAAWAVAETAHTASSAVRVIQGIAELGASLLIAASPTSLTGPIGKPRRYAVARASMHDIDEIREAFGASVNDVALAAITGAFRTLLISRKERPVADAVKSLIPVSTRTDRDDGVANRVSAITAFLPVDRATAVGRLRAVQTRMHAGKTGNGVGAADSAVVATRLLPFAPFAAIVRYALSIPQRSIITVTTNVAGPAHGLKLLGHPVIEAWPIVPLASTIRTGITMFSYDGQLTFGVITDYDSAPETALLAHEIERGIAELRSAARFKRPRPGTAAIPGQRRPHATADASTGRAGPAAPPAGTNPAR